MKNWAGKHQERAQGAGEEAGEGYLERTSRWWNSWEFPRQPSCLPLELRWSKAQGPGPESLWILSTNGAEWEL